MIYQALVVDDDIEIMVLICEILSQDNFVCQGIGGAKEALDMGASKLEEFSIIFTDLKMPSIDGFEFVYFLKRLGINTPVVAITGLEDKGKSIFELKDGRQRLLPQAIIQKPFTSEEIQKVHHLLKPSKSA